MLLLKKNSNYFENTCFGLFSFHLSTAKVVMSPKNMMMNLTAMAAKCCCTCCCCC